MLDNPQILNILIGLIVFFGGWFVRDLKKTQQDNSDKIAQVQLSLAKDYITKQEHESTSAAMFTKLDKIEDAIMDCKLAHGSGGVCQVCSGVGRAMKGD